MLNDLSSCVIKSKKKVTIKEIERRGQERWNKSREISLFSVNKDIEHKFIFMFVID